MKRTLLSGLLAAGLSLAAQAQDFTGSITYSFKVENLPPGVNEAMLDQFMPSRMTTFAKDGKTASVMNGGMMSKIVGGEKMDTSYMVVEKAERVFTMTKETADKVEKDAKVEKPTITKTKQTETIAGYPCTLYYVTTKASGTEVKTEAWVTEKIKLPKKKAETSSMIPTEVPGTPLRTVLNQQGMKITIEATEVSTAPPTEADLSLPAYHHEPFSQEALMKAMMGGK